ncbi:MAG: signal peptidase I [Anaerolineaceae bacterium]|nr:signal peptidase I [Anaerolineaceae bacterium]
MKALKRFFHLKTLRAAIGVVIMALAWVLLVPMQMGGQTSYVIVDGNSMEPVFYKGDLVLLRSQPEYEVRDIVTYKHPNIGTVIHRIIGRDLDRYLLQGDNNDWVDPYEPRRADLTGKYWFHLPGAGKILLAFRQPWILALIAGLSTVVIGMSMFESDEAQTTAISKPKKKQSFFHSLFTTMGELLADWKDNFWLVIYLLAAGGILLGAFAFTRPATRKISDETLYQQTGFFTYSGSATDKVYDSRKIESGDPIFPVLGCTVNFTFDYGLHTPKPFSGGGSYVINAEVRDTSGWHRIIPISASTPFEGSSFHTNQVLDVCAAQDLIDIKQEATGAAQSSYYLSLIPAVTVNGVVDGQILEDSFAPALEFVIAPQQVYLNQNFGENQDPFKPGTLGILSRDKIVPNVINIFQYPLPIPAARVIAIVCLALAATGAGLAIFVFKEAESSDERLWARLQIGEHMLSVSTSPFGKNDRVVDLDNLGELVQLVERYGGAVLFHKDPPYVNYYVRDNGVVYRCRQMERQYSLASGDNDFQQELLRALENNEFMLQYQPGVSLKTGKITQVEALLRWNHPERGLLMPMSFLPEAEAGKLIGWIDSWVLRTGCAQLRQWRDAGFPHFPMAINISSSQLRLPNIADMVEDALLENNLSADALQIDISEDQFSLDIDILQNLKSLRNIGVGITISSRHKNLLENTPEIASQVKVNYAVLQKSILAGAENSPQQWFENARAHKVNVIAMGVETPEELGFFQVNACDEVQGFFVRPPLTVNEITRELESGQTLIDLELENGAGR